MFRCSKHFEPDCFETDYYETENEVFSLVGEEESPEGTIKRERCPHNVYTQESSATSRDKCQ